MIDEKEKNNVVEEETLLDEEVENKEEIKTIDLSIFNKKKFSINGDPDKIIELDTSDLSIVTRIKEQYPVLNKLADKVSRLSAKTENLSDSELLDELGSGLKEIDRDMRNCIDTIFDSKVADICVPSGSMYDPVGGKLRYERLIDILVKLYDDNLNEEVRKIQNKVNKHTAKYTKK